MAAHDHGDGHGCWCDAGPGVTLADLSDSVEPRTPEAPLGITLAFGEGTDADSVDTMFARVRGFVFDVFDETGLRVGIYEGITEDEETRQVMLLFTVFDTDTGDAAASGETFTVDPYDPAVTLVYC